jgi:hypothetical protein
MIFTSGGGVRSGNGSVFGLAPEALTVNTGPVAVCPKIPTVIGPVVAPNGTIAVIAFVFALITRAGKPLKRTSRFWMRESK